MDSPETPATLGTRHWMKTNKINMTTQKTKRMMINTDITKNQKITKNRDEPKCSQGVSSFLYTCINYLKKKTFAYILYLENGQT